jgi:hypothetical protein
MYLHLRTQTEAGKITLFNDDGEPEPCPASAPFAEPGSTCRSSRSMRPKPKFTIATRLRELMEEARQLNDKICATRARLERKRANGIEIDFLDSDKEEHAKGAREWLKDDNSDGDRGNEGTEGQKIEEDIGGDWDSSGWVDDETFANCTKVRCYFSGMPEELLESYQPESSDDEDSSEDEAVWCD